MALALSIAGALAVAVAWLLVARGRASVWTAMGVVMPVAGAAALATGRVELADRTTLAAALGAGAAAGVALYAATRLFVAVVRRWPPFRRHVEEVYDQRSGLSLGAALAVALLLVAPGEELFWRGLVQSRLGAESSPLAGALVSWAVYVGANAVSGKLPIVAGAVVAGGVWGALAYWSGGIAASLLCHLIWTGAMIARPPGGGGR